MAIQVIQVWSWVWCCLQEVKIWMMLYQKTELTNCWPLGFCWDCDETSQWRTCWTSHSFKSVWLISKHFSESGHLWKPKVKDAYSKANAAIGIASTFYVEPQGNIKMGRFWAAGGTGWPLFDCPRLPLSCWKYRKNVGLASLRWRHLQSSCPSMPELLAAFDWPSGSSRRHLGLMPGHETESG